MNWLNHPFDICLNQERLVGWIRAVRGCVRMGGMVKNTVKRSGTEKWAGKTKILKSGDKLGQGVVAFKKGGGGWNPLTNYTLHCSLSDN